MNTLQHLGIPFLLLEQSIANWLKKDKQTIYLPYLLLSCFFSILHKQYVKPNGLKVSINIS